MCPSSVRRQPVILTNSEKEKIDKQYPGSYEHAIKYGSTPDKEHWYVCPRYWCLTKNVSLSQEQVDAGECGGRDAIIPATAKKVPEGKQIFEFTAKSEHISDDGSYVQHYPGFIPGSKHPDGKCIPCCFKSWDAPQQVKRRAECSGKSKSAKKSPKKISKKKKDEPSKKTPNKEKESKKMIKKPTKKSQKKIILANNDAQEMPNATEMPNAPEMPPVPAPAPESIQSSDSNQSLSSANTESPKRALSNEPEEYIKGPEKFPLEQNRWGYLPPEIAGFLNTQNEKCQISATDINIRPNHPCYLRHGVEVNPLQSFVACIADLYVEYTEGVAIPSIREMKKIIARSISLDSFPTYQNGNLVEVFYDETREIIIDNYSETTLFQQLDTTNEHEVLVFERIASAFENFKDYLKSTDVVIDFEYLWDIVTTPNLSLFPRGINLVILNVPEDDSTSNVEVICPTNAYATQFFDARKQTLILMRKMSGNNHFYEPIYLYTNKELAPIEYQKTFSEYGQLLPNMKSIITDIKKYLTSSCGPLKSQPNVYKFLPSIQLRKLVTELNSINAKINAYVLNYNGKVVAVHASYRKYSGILPCLPSGKPQSKDNTYKFIDDLDIIDSYENTMKFLSLVKSANKKIPCAPKVLIVDDAMLIGILTETNQFIGFSRPVPVSELETSKTNSDSLPIIEESSYTNFNKRITNYKDTSFNSERETYVRNIRLEKIFYSIFRNIARIELSKNVCEKEKMIRLFASYSMTLKDDDIDNKKRHEMYKEYLDSLVTIMRNVLVSNVTFKNYDEKTLDILKTTKIGLCDKCQENGETPYCEKINDGTGNTSCRFAIPAVNLINNNNNEEFYYLRLCDEILRNERIRQFMVEPDQILFLSDIPYELNESEIIILNSLLTQEYFLNKKPYKDNIFIKHDTFDTAMPAITEPYATRIEVSKEIQKYETQCFDGEKAIEAIKGKGKESWKALFGADFSALNLSQTSNCTIDVFIKALHEVKGKNSVISNIDITTIKKTLIIEYSKLFKKNYYSQIMKILQSQGKKSMVKSVSDNQAEFFDQVTSDTYYLTLLDYWILASHYDVPMLFLTSTTLVENNSNALSTTSNLLNKFIIIKLPGVKPDIVPEYKFFTNKPKEVVLWSELPRDVENHMKSIPYLTLDEMIEKFTPKKYVKKRKPLIVMND